LGQTHDLSKRLSEHNSEDNQGFTKRDKPWELIFSMDCLSQRAAMQIEMHLKKRKSKFFMERLMNEPELQNYFIQKYNGCS
jgi:putative endonuclease